MPNWGIMLQSDWFVVAFWDNKRVILSVKMASLSSSILLLFLVGEHHD